MIRIYFFLSMFLANSVLSLCFSSMEASATFKTFHGVQAIRFNPKKFTEKTAPLISSLRSSCEDGEINLDLKEFDHVDWGVIVNLFDFYAGKKLILNENNIAQLIEHADRFDLVLAGEELVRNLPTMMTIINNAETAVSFKQIAASICETVFDTKGYYRNEELWQVQLFTSLQCVLIDKNHVLYDLFDGILRTKKEKCIPKKTHSEVIIHTTEVKSDH